jgi:hypothetical protein
MIMAVGDLIDFKAAIYLPGFFFYQVNTLPAGIEMFFRQSFLN